MEYFRRNNFDLIRLGAAFQVMLAHGLDHLDVDAVVLRSVIAYVPGVPIFFFISGFLISASWERGRDVRSFAMNRALRIFPALWVTSLASVGTLFVLFDSEVLSGNLTGIIAWLLAQGTLFQQWNPGFLRGYGVGVVNGSLWTISVEIVFYILTPLLYWFAKRRALPIRTLLWGVVTASFGLQYGLHAWAPGGSFGPLERAVSLSFLPWIGMYCVGIIAQRSIDQIYPVVENRAPVFLAAFVLLAVFSSYLPCYPLLQGRSNVLGLFNYFALCALILSVAYTRRNFSDRLLRQNDISYGTYIIHMPVINALHHTGNSGVMTLVAAVVLTLGLATVSWHWIEKPALRRKRYSLYMDVCPR